MTRHKIKFDWTKVKALVPSGLTAIPRYATAIIGPGLVYLSSLQYNTGATLSVKSWSGDPIPFLLVFLAMLAGVMWAFLGWRLWYLAHEDGQKLCSEFKQMSERIRIKNEEKATSAADGIFNVIKRQEILSRSYEERRDGTVMLGLIVIGIMCAIAYKTPPIFDHIEILVAIGWWGLCHFYAWACVLRTVEEVHPIDLDNANESVREAIRFYVEEVEELEGVLKRKALRQIQQET